VELRVLVAALLAYDTLAVRQWVHDATRARLDWPGVRAPEGLDPLGMAVAAGVTEVLAARSGQSPPAWTARVVAAPEPIFLVRAAAEMPHLRRSCQEDGPEPLRRRGVYAPPEFLTSA
jgi:hypothetical protein